MMANVDAIDCYIQLSIIVIRVQRPMFGYDAIVYELYMIFVYICIYQHCVFVQ